MYSGADIPKVKRSDRMDTERVFHNLSLFRGQRGAGMNTEKWFEYLNNLSEEELERTFVGMNVKVVMQAGKIVKVINSAY